VGALYLRGGKCWCKYYVGGQPRRESTEKGKNQKKLAADFLKAREGAVATGAPTPPKLDRILYDEIRGDLRTHYETTGRRDLSEVDARLSYLNRFFDGRRAVSITPTLVTDYVASRQASKTNAGSVPSNRTINIELAILKRMLRLAYKHGKLLRVPSFDMLKEAPAREGFFEPHQYQAVRRQLPDDLRVAVAVAYTFGWRKSEILSLERRQLDLKTGTLSLDPGTTKNGEARTTYLTPDLRAQLAEQVVRVEGQRKLGRIVPHLFPHLKGRCAGRPRRGLAKLWTKACKEAGVPGRLLHDFRRTAVRNLERAGVARSVAMKITGHKTESVYRRYAIVSDADLQEAARKLAGTIPGTMTHASLDSPSVNAQNS